MRSRFRKLLEGSTPLPWKDWIEYRGARRSNIIARRDNPAESIGSVNVNDSSLIVAAVNTLPIFLSIAAAAKATLSYQDYSCGCDIEVGFVCGPCALSDALSALDYIEQTDEI